MYIHFKTFGCKVNLYETENMKQNFSSKGFTVTEKESESNIFVINTCTVTETGDKKVFKELRRLRREYPNAVIAVTGCYPQAFPDEAAKIPEADIVTGTKNRNALPEIIKDFLDNRTKKINICEYTSNDIFEDMCNIGYENNTRGFIKIQDGCNMFCTYCIIPYSRGRFRSKPIEKLKAEAEQLASAGYREIVLVGINLSFYGIEYKLRLADAVETVCAVDGIERVRLGSLEPEMITDDDIRRLSAQPKLCPHFHLSLQSGCDKTLKEMNRRYTTADYTELVKKLREKFENCSITTDVMVGFPNETDEDFTQSAEFVRKIGFSKIHVFPYSQRKGTPAADFDDQIPTWKKNIRAKAMADVAEESQFKFLQSQSGLTVPVLFEREKSDKIPHGYTPNYTLVKIFTKISEKSLRNRIFYVKIERIENDYCVGEIISEQ
ncbi:MAG: tRNA (N(6)-L-threonylcarbamoyladenosine(37)-C(2))-methylthiotransferase MtaB [Oscillospiraceae bacterium]